MVVSKPWYLSRTIWASMVTVLTGAAGLTSFPLDNSALTDALLQAISAVSGLIAVFGRLSAKHRIG